MITKTDLTIPPSSINDKEFLYSTAAKKLGRDLSEITAVITEKRSVDARENSLFMSFPALSLLMNPRQKLKTLLNIIP